MKNQRNPIKKAEKFYLLAQEVAENFIGMYPNEELSRAFTDTVYEELREETHGISKIQFYDAARIAIYEIIEKNKLRDRALKDITRLLPDSSNAHLKVAETSKA